MDTISHDLTNASVRPRDNEDTFLPLLVALVLMLVLAPLLQLVPLLVTTLSPVVLLAGLWAVLCDRTFRMLLGAALLVCLPLRWGAHFFGTQAPLLILLSHATVGITFAIMEVVVVVRVLGHQRITRQTVIGAICGYLLIAFVFTFGYSVLTFLNPAAIFVGGHPLAAERITNLEEHVTELMYFSFITLTTVGYGDIVPMAPMARSMVVLEALAGQLYLAAFVARLVGAMSKPEEGR